MNTEMQSRLFEHMGGRDAYDNLYKLKPDLARQLEEETAADYERAEERHIAPDDIFAYALNPDSPCVKEGVIGEWAHNIKWYLTHNTEKPMEEVEPANTEMQSRLFERIWGRDAYDNLYKLKPDLARQLEEETAPGYERAKECFAMGLEPAYPVVALAISEWANNIEWYLMHNTGKPTEEVAK